ncbi:MAG TPA: hypothetical protein VHO06_23525 [Polyangia bacterium]|nr:hypothetical protein [Polyangia bacterium]
MSDDEWERWRAVYGRRTRPIPPVLKRARTDRARALGAMLALYAIGLAIAVPVALDFRRARTTLGAIDDWLGLGLLGLLVVGTQLAMRGTLGRPAAEPAALLAGLERRHAGRRRLLRFMPWATGLLVGGTIASAATAMIAARAFAAGEAVSTAVVCGVTVWLVRAVSRRTRKVIDRELAEAAEARRLLEEGEAAPANGR